MPNPKSDQQWMMQAIELAQRGQGLVEPNPMVGCLIVVDDVIISTGYHQKFGEAHAETNALHGIAPELLSRSTIYISLEPCNHHGHTPPCVDAIIAAKPQRVCIGCLDPNPQTNGTSVNRLRGAGIATDVGIAQYACDALIAPFRKLMTRAQPFVIAKWAMTLDGKIASTQGHSQWISNKQSLEVVHSLRGRMDGIIIGSRTALNDDPMLTARPPGGRVPTRIILDSQARIALSSKIVQSAREYPTIVVCHPSATDGANRLLERGCSIFYVDQPSPLDRIDALLTELGKLKMTNVLVEGGGLLLGSFFDQKAIDEVHVFVAPKLIGGAQAVTPIAGIGLPTMDQCVSLTTPTWKILGDNCYVQSRIRYLANDETTITN